MLSQIIGRYSSQYSELVFHGDNTYSQIYLNDTIRNRWRFSDDNRSVLCINWVLFEEPNSSEVGYKVTNQYLIISRITPRKLIINPDMDGMNFYKMSGEEDNKQYSLRYAFDIYSSTIVPAQCDNWESELVDSSQTFSFDDIKLKEELIRLLDLLKNKNVYIDEFDEPDVRLELIETINNDTTIQYCIDVSGRVKVKNSDNIIYYPELSEFLIRIIEKQPAEIENNLDVLMNSSSSKN